MDVMFLDKLTTWELAEGRTGKKYLVTNETNNTPLAVSNSHSQPGQVFLSTGGLIDFH